jgi:hypothetical protein
MAVDEGHLYFTTYVSLAYGPGHGAVFSIPIQGGPVAKLATTYGPALGLAVDASYLYWSEPANDRILRLAK